MNSVLTNPSSVGILVAAACYLLVNAGLAKRQLVRRERICEACHRPMTRCTCYWR